MNKTAALAQSTCSHLGRAQPNLSGPTCASLAALHTVSTGCSVLPFPNHLDLPVEMLCLLTWKRCFLELDFKKQDAWCNHLSTILSACMKPHSSRYLLSDKSGNNSFDYWLILHLIRPLDTFNPLLSFHFNVGIKHWHFWSHCSWNMWVIFKYLLILISNIIPQ